MWLAAQELPVRDPDLLWRLLDDGDAELTAEPRHPKKRTVSKSLHLGVSPKIRGPGYGSEILGCPQKKRSQNRTPELYKTAFWVWIATSFGHASRASKDELVVGVDRLKGTAKGIDLAAFMMETRALQARGIHGRAGPSDDPLPSNSAAHAPDRVASFADCSEFGNVQL